MAQADVNSQEQWLRYSNWEHRSSRPRPSQDKAKSGAASAAVKAETGKSKDVLTPLPENPGFETVQGGQFTIPGWALNSSAEPADAGHIDVYPGQAVFPGSFGTLGYGGVSAGGSAFAGSSSPFAYGMSSSRIPFVGGLLGGMLAGSSGTYRPWSRQSPLGAGIMQIQTRPSPASGNYYQPSSADSSASGNYYSSGTPWQIPISGPVSSPKDYWGPMGSPFK